MNLEKTETTIIFKRNTKEEEIWRHTKKLGSLIGDDKDIEGRKQLAQAALKKLTKIWMNCGKVSESTRLRLYNAYVRPVLLYNSGTWGITDAACIKLDTFHRRQLRRVLGIHYPQRIRNQDLYNRCRCHTIRYDIMLNCWKLFGHVLRLHPATPCNIHMSAYFNGEHKGHFGRPRMNLPQRLQSDLKAMSINRRPPRHLPLQLKSTTHLEQFRTLASDRKEWLIFIKSITTQNQHIDSVAQAKSSQTKTRRKPMLTRTV